MIAALLLIYKFKIYNNFCDIPNYYVWIVRFHQHFPHHRSLLEHAKSIGLRRYRLRLIDRQTSFTVCVKRTHFLSISQFWQGLL